MSTVFLTGGTGVVGSAIARTLLEQTDVRLSLLMRGQSDEDVRERLRMLGRFWPEAEFSARAVAVRGDTSLPRFGLDPATECSHLTSNDTAATTRFENGA